MSEISLPQIFISYARVDSDFVDRLEADLRVRGHRTWVDRMHLEGGEDWEVRISQEIVRSGSMIIVLSPEAVASKWVRREITLADARNIPIIPLLFKPVERVPLAIAERQFIDITTTYDRGLRELLLVLTKMQSVQETMPAIGIPSSSKNEPKPVTASSAKNKPATPLDTEETVAGDLVKPHPAPPPVNPNLTTIYREAVATRAAGDLEKAEVLFKQVAQEDPNFGNGIIRQDLEVIAKQLYPARQRRLRQQVDEAVRSTNWRQATAIWQAFVALTPNDTQALQGLIRTLQQRAQAAMNNGNWGEAIGTLEAMVRIDPTQKRKVGNLISQLIANQQYAWLYDNARTYLAEGNAAAARDALQNLWQYAPQYGDPDGVGHSLRLLSPIERQRITRRRFLIGGVGVGTVAIIALPSINYLNFVNLRQHMDFTYKSHTDNVQGVAWSPDGKRIASASEDHTAQVWNAVDGSNPFTYKSHTDYVRDVVWSPDGKRIASASFDGTVQVWNSVDGSNPFTYKGHTNIVFGVAWSPDGKRIASASADGTVQVWNAVDGSSPFTYKGHTDFVNSVAWSPDGKRIASASGDSTVQVWNAVNGSNPFTYKGHSYDVFGVVWSPDGKRIASASFDTTVQVWNAIDGSNPFTYKSHTDYVLGVAWSPDGKRIASAGDKTVQVWHP